MKVYIVTSGIYSDYCIERVFLDKEKAEEYAKWVRDSNDVEEFDTADDCFNRKQYVVCISLKWGKDEGEILSSNTWRDSGTAFSYNHYYDYLGCEELVIVRVVDSHNYDEKYWIDKLTKVAYDLKGYVEYLKSEGRNRSMINEALRSK